jgi:hypothetical protein
MMRQVGCIAYREDGRICGEPAMVLDLQRGGMVCDRHAPQGGERPPGAEGQEHERQR